MIITKQVSRVCSGWPIRRCSTKFLRFWCPQRSEVSMGLQRCDYKLPLGDIQLISLPQAAKIPS